VIFDKTFHIQKEQTDTLINDNIEGARIFV